MYSSIHFSFVEVHQRTTLGTLQESLEFHMVSLQESLGFHIVSLQEITAFHQATMAFHQEIATFH